MSSPKHTANRLINETSPYLLQHAYNPVDWYPWGEEAFELAQAENKPLLVSIGYSACHWCHVMEHESFEDEETARVMNENFVNIKVDMEERPDVDHIYMSFVQMTTGRGGWPMNVFITPDKRPFFGGTYFPPAPRYGMPSWQQILLSIAEAYKEKRDEIEHSANEIVGELRRLSMVDEGTTLSNALLDDAFASFERSFDAKNGGFGGAPKFPQAMSLEFLLRHHYSTHDQKALEMTRLTLDKMAFGGMYDQLGGGFHRYSVDNVWLVPHFEKMLYDNAQLARIYLHAFQVTGDPEYRRIATETLDYVLREMTNPSGGFYSSQDADSEGEEGKFFVWSEREIDDLLGDDSNAFKFFFDVSKDGNFEERNILNRPRTIDSAASALKIEPFELFSLIENAKQRLFDAREARVKPHRDEKVLASWNGLMLAAFADAAGVLGDDKYLKTAEKNAEFLLSKMLTLSGRLFRSWKAGEAKLNGYLDDYANVADGLLALYQVTGNIRFFQRARSLVDLMLEHFWDQEAGGFFYTSNDHEELVVRTKDFTDNATPSGNSAAADVLLRIAKLTGNDRYERFAVATLRLAANQIARYPQGFGRALSTLGSHLYNAGELAIVGPAGNELAEVALATYLPTTTVALSSDPDNDAAEVPLFEGRGRSDRPLAFLCKNFVCSRPAVSAAELREMLAANEKGSNV
ncbi:MAG TPA: thioredoxin domain-containing protein [Pyrinomonadaceae bacterium]|nr:thioredoxin domain-containing protein [Pyrinomonadaceae bacterium]